MSEATRQVEGSPAVKPEKKKQDRPKYNEVEKQYLGYLQTRLESWRNARDSAHDELDGMTIPQYYESNLKLANSFIEPKKNKEDTTFVTGTTRGALLALCARMNGFNLTSECRAYDEDNVEDVRAGRAMETILAKSAELDHDEEKRMLRQYELFAQGTAFVEEAWTQEFRMKKTLSKKDWNGEVSGVKWEERLELAFEGSRRNIIPGLHVYLGSYRIFDMERQPGVATAEIIPYDEAKGIYGKWERWDYVTRELMQLEHADENTMYMNNWRLTDVQKDYVEVIKYQDKFNNEFCIILNGVLMTPVGFPMPWCHGEYNLVKQVNEILTPVFPLGGSLCKRLKTSQALENEFWRSAILKTQKSYSPARFNMTGKVLSRRVFMPGSMTMGVDPAQIKLDPHESQGVSQSEVEIMRMVRQNMNENSLPEVSKGQAPTGSQTATETLAVQREARVVMNLALTAASMLERKLDTLRAFDILENWFDPIGTEVDEIKQVLKKKHRSASASASIEGAGQGRRMVRVDEEIPTAKEIYDEEENLSKEEKRPVRVSVLHPEKYKNFKYTWYFVNNPKEKESSELDKAMFDTMMARLPTFGQDVNVQFFEEKFAEMWNLPADKAFKRSATAITGMPMQGGEAGAGAPPGAVSGSDMMPGAAPGGTQKPTVNTMAKAPA